MSQGARPREVRQLQVRVEAADWIAATSTISPPIGRKCAHTAGATSTTIAQV